MSFDWAVNNFAITAQSRRTPTRFTNKYGYVSLLFPLRIGLVAKSYLLFPPPSRQRQKGGSSTQIQQGQQQEGFQGLEEPARALVLQGCQGLRCWKGCHVQARPQPRCQMAPIHSPAAPESSSQEAPEGSSRRQPVQQDPRQESGSVSLAHSPISLLPIISCCALFANERVARATPTHVAPSHSSFKQTFL